MKVEITGKNLEVTESIRAHIEAKFDKLAKWQVTLITPRVAISEEPNKQFRADATIGVPNKNLVASSIHEDLYAAINEMVHKLSRQLNKLQHKPDSRRATHIERPEVDEE